MKFLRADKYYIYYIIGNKFKVRVCYFNRNGRLNGLFTKNMSKIVHTYEVKTINCNNNRCCKFRNYKKEKIWCESCLGPPQKNYEIQVIVFNKTKIQYQDLFDDTKPLFIIEWLSPSGWTKIK